MLAKCDGFDTIVVALVGERGREVREFLEGPIHANLHKSVMVVSTGDESPMMRRQAPRTAVAVAEYFRDCGDSVLLIVDSVTRYAHAARDVAFSVTCPVCWKGQAPEQREKVRLPASSRSSLTATTIMTQSLTIFVERSMGTSFWTAPSRIRDDIRPSTSWDQSRVWPIMSGRQTRRSSCVAFAA
jgi:flagellar biosynthesis/type III secretory pathway ATPase